MRALALAVALAMAATSPPVAGATVADATAGVVRADDAPPDDVALLDFLYLEPNEGSASAGHVAIAFGNRTYDFERGDEGLLELERRTSRDFRFHYAVLGNRAIHRVHVAVSPATRALLRDGFDRTYLVQQGQLARRAALARERRLLELLLGRGDQPGFAVEGAGFFLPPDGAPPSPALARLRARVLARSGTSALDDRIDALRRELRGLVPAVRAPLILAPDVLPPAGDAFAADYSAHMTAIVALEILRDGPALRDGSTFTAAPGDAPLGKDEARALATFARDLEDALVRLLRSQRPDWGTPFLVGMARLAAIERSLASGRLVVLDAFAADAHRMAPGSLRRAPALAAAVLDDAVADLHAARGAFVAAASSDELDYAQVESAGARLAELRRGLDDGRDIRVQSGLLVPAAAATHTDLTVPDAAAAELAAAHAAVVDDERYCARELDRLYGYELIAHNCASEIFRTIDAVLAPPPHDAAAESTRRLGGYIRPGAGLTFLPYVAAVAARRAWTVAAVDEIPAYRTQRVAALRRTASPAWITLRESNTLTSAVYRRSRDDSIFLFFTDGELALRPLLGAVNIAVGFAAGAAGLALAPLDGGATVSAGLRGVLYSVPELAFVNIRKGSFDYVEHELAAPLVALDD